MMEKWFLRELGRATKRYNSLPKEAKPLVTRPLNAPHHTRAVDLTRTQVTW